MSNRTRFRAWSGEGYFFFSHFTGCWCRNAFCKFLLSSLKTTSQNVHRSRVQNCESLPLLKVKIEPFTLFSAYSHSKLSYFALVPNEMNQYWILRGFNEEQFEFQKPTSQLFGTLLKIRYFECEPFSYRSFRTTEQNPEFQRTDFCGITEQLKDTATQGSNRVLSIRVH